MIRPPFKCHGSKRYLYQWILDKLPGDFKELTFIEGCVGGGSIFTNKKPSREEIINDVDKKITSIWKTLRDQPQQFINQLSKIKYDEESFLCSKEVLGKDISTLDTFQIAFHEFIIRRMSVNGLKKEYSSSTVDDYWDTIIPHLLKVSERLQDTIILNQDIVEIIQLWNNPEVVFYIDPPDLPTIRSQPLETVSYVDMSTEGHVDFMHKIKDSKAKVMISGYSSNLYNKHLKTWKCHKQEIPIDKKNKRIECLWCNFTV